MEYAENLINIKQRGRGPIILRKYMKKYGRIEASYTDDKVSVASSGCVH